jgi:hypothetical protein
MSYCGLYTAEEEDRLTVDNVSIIPFAILDLDLGLALEIGLPKLGVIFNPLIDTTVNKAVAFCSVQCHF